MDRINKREQSVENENELDINSQEDDAAIQNGISLYPMSDLKVDKGFYTVFELKRRYDADNRRIILDSDFQREDVWNNDRKAELVESVLMGLPLPIFYFNQDKYGRLIVIDGRQRLTSLFDFMDGKFPLNKLKILPEENKKKFEDLSPLLRSRIEDYQIQAHVIMPPTPDRLKFDIFDRVNRGGIQLNKQEIRNALYQGKVTNLLRRIATNEIFSKATGNAFVNEKRMKDKYLLTRFIALYLWQGKYLTDESGKMYIYRDDIDDLLGKTMEFVNQMEDDDVLKIEKIVLSSLQKSLFYCGEDAFRLMRNGRKTPINMNVFETIMYCMTFIRKKDESHQEEIRKEIRDLITSETFADNIGNHRDSSVKLLWRMKKAERIGKEYR